MKFHFPLSTFHFPLLLLLPCFLICACHHEQQQDDSAFVPPNTQEVNKQLIPSQKMYIRQETDEINQYIAVHKYSMQTTGTGIHYMIYEHGKGALAKVGDYVQISYTISLLDDTLCYDSKNDGPREFRVGKDDVESGVHQAVQLMHPGDKGLFIIPSYLAQGIAGDRDKIPPSAVVIYDITLLKVQDKP
jgi:FKBP-type peptidyl-prolyl cis-trans isomerase